MLKKQNGREKILQVKCKMVDKNEIFLIKFKNNRKKNKKSKGRKEDRTEKDRNGKRVSNRQIY